MSSPHPLITGIALATPLGESARKTWDALRAGEYITHHTLARGIAECDGGRIAALTERVAHEAVSDASWSDADRRDAAVVLGTSKGPVTTWLTPPPEHMYHKAYVSVGRQAFGLADTTARLRQSLRMDGPALTLSAACASGLHALIRGALMIRSGEAARVLVVTAESSVHPLFLGSFQRLKLLPPEGTGCRPFDERRNGFLMSEAAAAVCLEPADTFRRGKVAIERFGFGSDATHLTGSDPRAEALRRILAGVLDGRPVDLVHAHGTGTILNDPLELAALESSLPGDDLTPLYSHKGALGHSLGASGLVSVVLNVMCHARGVVLPNVRTSHPLPMQRLQCSVQEIHRPIHRSLAIAAGFGGAVAAVTLGQVD